MERSIINITYTALDIVTQGENSTSLHHAIFGRSIMASNTPFSDMGNKESFCICSGATSQSSLAHHFVAFMHHVRFNILMSVTLKKTVIWNLQPAVGYSCTDLRYCMASHPRFIFVMKLLCRHLTKLLGCNNIPLQGLYITTQTHIWQRHTTRPQVEFTLTTWCLRSTKQYNFKQQGGCKQLF
jgi:hypothetical protein